MKTNIIACTGIGLLVVFALAFVSIFQIHLASAQVDATSSPPSSVDGTTTPLVLQESATTTPVEDAASSTLASAPANDSASIAVATSSPSTSTSTVEPPPQGLALVHIVGTKYTDYFTDGTTVTSYPGDPAIDSNFDKADAPIPTHAGLTWVHTTGAYLYDTLSGDLEVGDYAVQPSGSYIENVPPFISSTSTPATDSTATPTVLGASTSTVSASPDTTTAMTDTSTPSAATTSKDASPSAPDTSTSTVPSSSDNSAGTTTGSGSSTPTL